MPSDRREDPAPLLDPYETLITTLRSQRESRSLQSALAIGGAILDDFGQDSTTLSALARRDDFPLSVSTLSRYVAITALCRRLGRFDFAHLGTSHFRLVLPLDEPVQAALLDAAETGRWTVRRMAREARARSKSPGRTSFSDALPLLLRWAQHPARLEGLDSISELDEPTASDLSRRVRAAMRDLGELSAALLARR